MALISKKLRSVQANVGKAFAHWCPGCDEAHLIWYQRDDPQSRPTWSWDGNADAPTCSPSIRYFDNDGTRCHYFLKAGQIEFCGDCRHPLSGKTVSLPDWPHPDGAYGGVIP